MQIAELGEAFLAANQNHFLPNTRLSYGYDLGLLHRAFPDLPADAVTTQHRRAFLHSAAELAPSTVARRQATLRSCFSWAYRNDFIPVDPTAKLEPIKVPEREPRPLPSESDDLHLPAGTLG